MKLLSWVIFITFAKTWTAAELDKNGELWMIKSSAPRDETNKLTSNEMKTFRRSNMDKRPETFLIRATPLDRPTRAPKEKEGSFETSLPGTKEVKSNEVKSKVAMNNNKEKTVNNYLLRVNENELLNDAKAGEVETLPKRSTLSRVADGKTSRVNAVNQTHVTKQRQDIEQSPESFAGQSVGKPYGDPDGYQTIGDGIYLMSSDQEKAFAPGASTQGVELASEHADTEGMTSSKVDDQGTEQTGVDASGKVGQQGRQTSGDATSENAGYSTDKTPAQGLGTVNKEASDNAGQTLDKSGAQASGTSEYASEKAGQAPGNTETQTSSKAGEGASDSNTGIQPTGKAGEGASDNSGQASDNAKTQTQQTNGYAGSQDQGNQAFDASKSGNSKETSELSAGNLNQILTTLDTDEPSGKFSADQNATMRNSTNPATESSKLTGNGTQEHAFASMQSASPVYGPKAEPTSDIEAVTPKEFNVLQTFEDTLNVEDNKIKKEMSSGPTSDNKQEAFISATNAMIQSLNKAQLDTVLDKLKTEDSAFIRKNPYVADKSKLLDALRSIKYKNMAVTKRGFLSTNDNIPVEKLYDSLLKEDEWLKNGMTQKAESKDSIGRQFKDLDEDKVKDFLSFAENEDEKIPAELHLGKSRSQLQDSTEISQPPQTQLGAPQSKASRIKSKKGKKKEKLSQPKILVIEPPKDMMTASSSARSSSNIADKDEKLSPGKAKSGVVLNEGKQRKTEERFEKARTSGTNKERNDEVSQDENVQEMVKSRNGRLRNDNVDGENVQTKANEDDGKAGFKNNIRLLTEGRQETVSDTFGNDLRSDSAGHSVDELTNHHVANKKQNMRKAKHGYLSKKRKHNKKLRKIKVGGRHGNRELIMKDGELKNELFTNDGKQQKQIKKSSGKKNDKDYYWHGTQKPETRQLPTDPTETMRKFGRISNMLPPSIENDLSKAASRFIGDKNNIASDGTEVRKGNDDPEFRDLKEYGSSMKSYKPLNKINENEISSTSFFSASKSSGGTPKVFEKQRDPSVSPTVIQDAVKEIETKDMQDVKGYIDKDASKTLAFFDQNSLEPKIEEFDDVRKQKLENSEENNRGKSARPKKKVKVVLHLPELDGDGVHEIHGKDSDDPIGSIKKIGSEFTSKKKRPGIGQQLADDDEDALEELLSKPTAKLIQFHQPTTAASSEIVPENSVGQEAKEWSKESEDKETVPMEGSNVEDGRERNDMTSAFTGKSILEFIKNSEKGLKDDLRKEDQDDDDSPGDVSEAFESHKTSRKKQARTRPKKQRSGNKNESKFAAFSQSGLDSSEQGEQEGRGDVGPNIYADQMKYEQKQREVSELMPTEAVNQIKAILGSDDHSLPIKFLEKDRQMFNPDSNRIASDDQSDESEITDSNPDSKLGDEEAGKVLDVTYIKSKDRENPISDPKPRASKQPKASKLKVNPKLKNTNKEPNIRPEVMQTNSNQDHFSILSNLLPSSRKIQIQGGKILGGKILGGKIKGGLIKGGLVDGGNIEGGSILGGKVEGGLFRDGRMENGVLYNGTVEGGVIKGGEIYGGRMMSGLIEGGKLKGGSVNGGRLSGGEIDGGSLKSGEVQGGFLRDGSVEGGILKGGWIEGGHLLGGVMLGGHLRGGVVKSGVIRGGIIEGGVVEGGVIDDGVVIKGGVTRGFGNGTAHADSKSKDVDGSDSNSEHEQSKKKEKHTEKITEKNMEKSDSTFQSSPLESTKESPTRMYKINVDGQSPEDHSVEPSSQHQDLGDTSGRSSDHDSISILGAPESWPVKNKDLGNADDNKQKVAPVTNANSGQPRPKPVTVKEEHHTGGKIASISKLRELLKDLEKDKGSSPAKQFGERSAQDFSQMSESDGLESHLYMFRKPTVSAIGWLLGRRNSAGRNFGTTTRTIKNPSKRPANLKYHWSLNSVRGGKILGSPGKNIGIVGGVKIHNGIATMNDASNRGYLDAGDYQGECLSDPDVCKNGLTVSITNKIYKDSIESPTRMYLFDSGAGSEDSRGIALWVNRGRIEGAVATRKGTWCLGEDIRPFGDRWVDLVMTWKPSQGLYLFANCQLLAVSGFGTGCDVCRKQLCHQTDSNTHFMIARPNKGPHFKLTHFSSGDISVYEDFFTIDGVKDHCGSNNDYLRKNPVVLPARSIAHVPIKSPWDSSSIVMKKEHLIGSSEFINPEKSVNADSNDEFQLWPTPSGLNNFNKVATKSEKEKVSRASSRQDVKVDGGFSEWTTWTPCTGACGGTSMSVRYCNNPVPKLDGKDCSVLGPARRTRICSSTDCLDTSKKAKIEQNNFQELKDADISKRKYITRIQPNYTINQNEDINKLRQEFETLKSR